MTDSQASGRRLVNATAVMASGTMASRILGLVRAALLAFVLGNGTLQVEAFNVANTVPTSLYLLLAGGTLNNVLVPQIVRAVTHDEDGGKAFIDRIITGFVVVLGALTVLVTIATPLVMSLYTAPIWRTPDLADHWRSLLLMSFICMPQLFFYGVFFLISQVLNAREKFGPMMWAPIANNVVSIAVFVLYLWLWGSQSALSGQPFTDQQAWVLALGSTIGIVVQTLVLLPYLKRTGFSYHPRFDLKGTGLGRTFHVAKWMVGYVALTSVAQIVVANLASAAAPRAGGDSAGGGWTVYQNAYLIWILPHSLLTVSLATAMLPAASRYAVAGDRSGVAAETNRALRLATTFLLPASVGLAVLAYPITRIIYGNGSGAHDFEFIAWALIGFAIGLVPFTIQYLYLRAFYAMDNTRTPFLLQIWISTANALLALAFVLPWGDPGTVAARLALSYSVSYFIGALITHRVLRRRLPELPGGETLRHLGRLLVATVPAAALAWAITWWFERYPGLLMQALGLALAGGVAVLAFFFTAKRLGIPEATSMLEQLRRPRGAATPTDTVPASVEQSDQEDDQRADPALAGGIHDAGGEVLQALSEPVPDPDGQGVFVPVAPPASVELLDFPEPPIAGSPQAAASATGRVLGERYRLEEQLAVRNRTQTWRAHDTVLGRAVLVNLLDADDPGTAEVLRLSREAALATDSRFLRVLDVVDSEEGTGPYLVYEYAPGQTLEKVLRGGALTGVESAWIVREVADALIALHAQGHYHRHLSPATVLVTASGNVKVLGLGVNDASRTASHLDGEATDVRALGQLLYACLVARWPGGDRFGLQAAPVVDGHWVLPSQVQPGVTVAPAVDRVADRILSPTPKGRATRLLTAQDVTTQLSLVLGPMGASHDLRKRLHPSVDAAESDADTPPPVSRVAPPVPTPAASRFSVSGRAGSAGGAGSAAGSVGSAGATGNVVPERPGVTPGPALPEDDDPGLETAPFVDEALSRADSFTPVPPPATASPTPDAQPVRRRPRWPLVLGIVAVVLVIGIVAAVALTVRPGSPSPAPGTLKVVKVADFDPKADGGNGAESDSTAKLAVDGDPATAWRTQKYATADFGGDKPGVGLVLDLGEERTVTAVRLTLVGEPNSVALKVPVKASDNAPMKSAEQWRDVVGSADNGTSATLAPKEPARTRFLLVYFTSLPPAGDGVYRGGIAGITVEGPS